MSIFRKIARVHPDPSGLDLRDFDPLSEHCNTWSLGFWLITRGTGSQTKFSKSRVVSSSTVASCLPRPLNRGDTQMPISEGWSTVIKGWKLTETQPFGRFNVGSCDRLLGKSPCPGSMQASNPCQSSQLVSVVSPSLNSNPPNSALPFNEVCTSGMGWSCLKLNTVLHLQLANLVVMVGSSGGIRMRCGFGGLRQKTLGSAYGWKSREPTSSPNFSSSSLGITRSFAT